ncbi:hypothetical protein T439DRAFT_299983 [Meredithblackwellia eburnea MCA 4105]
MHGHGHGDEPTQLPVVNFSIVDPSMAIPPEVHEKQAQGFGFNGGGVWEGSVVGENDSGRYIRWLQPMESDLAKQVEYDMDEQDLVWLEGVNNERKKENQNPVSLEAFEIIFDKIEKEWFDLTKRIPKKENALHNEDSKCAICDDGECENSNAIVFCDGCNLAVHQDCYGVPYIPEGQWLCRKCTVSPDKPVSCVLCPNSYGAFKQTTTAQWAHLLCAIWIPDTGVSNTVYMEPIDGVENISKNRWKLVCYLCRKRVGACIQCANRSCFTAFHVTCARERGLELKMKQGGERGELRAYCEKHAEHFIPPEDPHPTDDKSQKKSGSLILKRSKNGAPKFVFKDSSSKSARAYKATYSSGPPVIPAFIFNRVVDYTSKMKMAKRQQFISLVCRYWSLKREARRGAPLLKRLHLEPWTASATSRQQTDDEKAKKLDLLRQLRNDLEKVRMLTELVRKREKKKLERANVFKHMIDDLVFPKTQIMRSVLDRIALLDKSRYFAAPVSQIQVPTYYDVIKHPMDWSTMREKLDRQQYLTATDFRDDYDLVINNARRFNKEDSIVHKHAVKVHNLAQPILAELEALDVADDSAVARKAKLNGILFPEILAEVFEFQDSPEPPPPTPPPAPAPVPSLNTAVPEQMDAKDITQGPSPSSDEKKTLGSAATGPDKGKKRAAVVAGLDDAASRARASPRVRTIQNSITANRSSSTPTAGSSRIKHPTDGAAASKAAGDDITSIPGVAVVDDVDSRDQFKLFESGWILPPGSSRRRNNSQISAETPVSSTSKLPALLSPRGSPELNLPPPQPISLTTEPTSPELFAPSPGTKAVASTPTKDKSETAPKSTKRPRSKKVKGPDGAKGVSDEADEGQQAAGPVESHPLSTSTPAKETSTVKVPAKIQIKGKGKVTDTAPVEETPLAADQIPVPTSKVEVEDEKDGRAVAVETPTKTKSNSQLYKEWKEKLDALMPTVTVSKVEQLPDGSQVWAKFMGSPLWPAEVADPKNPETDPKFLSAKNMPSKGQIEKYGEHVLVLFFDDRGSGAWLPLKDLFFLGENQEWDDLCLERTAFVRKDRTSANAAWAQLKEGYQRARENMELPEESVAKVKGTGKSRSRKNKD